MPITKDFPSLVQQAREGHVLAFDALVRRFQDMAFGYALSLVSDRALAEDAAQEAFLEVYRCLPGLREAAAFPGWLRRLVFKHCDRATRGLPHRAMVPLEAARDMPTEDVRSDPVIATERRQEARRVREAVRALPNGEREVTALFYFSGCRVREIAAFLEMPEATVRTRLHRARRRLRKELTPMEMEKATQDTTKSRPSDSARFADRVLSEIVEEYRRQRREDPETADRSLLAQAKERVEEHLRQGMPLAFETARTGQGLLAMMGEHDLRIAVLRHFLGQTLSVSEEAWARFFLVNALAAGGRSAECVAAQEEMYNCAQTTFPTNPPRLRHDWDFDPTNDPTADTYPVDTLLLWTVYIPDAWQHWVKVGRGDEQVRRFYEVLHLTPTSDANRQQRFYLLRMGMITLLALGRTNEAREVADRVAALADEETEEAKALHWRGYAADLRMIIAERVGDREVFQTTAEEAFGLLAEYERIMPPEDSGRFRILRDNIASILSDNGLHDMAIPLLKAEVESGSGTAWNYVRLAASTYATTKDRTETLRLLRQGALRSERWDMWAWCRARPAFADVAHDAEFAQAASRPPQGGTPT